MAERRLIGIWFVAAYCFAKSVFIADMVVVTLLYPYRESEALGTIGEIIPLVQRLDAGLVASQVTASAFVVFGIVLGISVLMRRKWAAAYIVAYHGIALLWYIAATLGLRMIGLDESSGALLSPYAKVEIVSSLLMVAYLFQPAIMRSFGFS